MILTVVHFAAESHVDRSIKNPEVFVQTNVLGTAVMLNCAKAAWELPDGTFRKVRNSYMCLQMKYMALWMMIQTHISTRQHHTTHIAHTQQVRHLLICL